MSKSWSVNLREVTAEVFFSDFKERYKLFGVRSLVDLDTCVTGRVRLLNPFGDEVVIRQGATLGYVEPIKDVEYICWLPAAEAISSALSSELVVPRGSQSWILPVGDGCEEQHIGPDRPVC